MNFNPILQGYKNQKIYKFLHLPIQSGNNDILKKMNRKYTVKDCMNIIEKFRDNFPDISIATDIIVGFPSETEEKFQNTINLLKKIKPDITNITKYSARPYTKAKQMDGRIKTEVVKERSKILTNLCSKISKVNNKKYIGKKFTVLITEEGKNNTYVGGTDNYKPVVIKEDVEIGEFLSVVIADSASTYLVGKLI